MDVIFKCVRERGKLRVKIVSPNTYSRVANCQFPRDLREDGATYSAPQSAISVVKIHHKIIYRVKPQFILRIREKHDYSQYPIYDADETTLECTVCFDSKKTQVVIPCGHYALCIKCVTRVKLCPICREPIRDYVSKLEMDSIPE
jgi:hypothetical protein